MAHEFEKGFFVGQSAWHGLGTVLDQVVDADQAYRLAFPWHILEQDIYSDISQACTLPVGKDQIIPVKKESIKTHKLLIRSDNQEQLGVVTQGYQVLQPYAMAQWVQPLLDTGLFTLETGLCLRNGKRLVIVLKVKNSDFEVTKGDRVEQYLVIAQGTDGTLRVVISPSNIRVVCMNTLNAFLGSMGDNAIGIKHTSGMDLKLDIARDTLKACYVAREKGIEAYKAMAARKLESKNELEKYAYKVLALPAPEGAMIEDRPRAVDFIMNSYESGPGANLVGVKGTYWGAYNAVTDYVDHQRGRTRESSLDGSWFGEGAKIRQRAYAAALDLN